MRTKRTTAPGKTFAQVLMAIVLIAGMVPAISLSSKTEQAYADDRPTVTDVLGIPGSSVLNVLESHENDLYYLETPYKYKPDANPYPGFDESSDWRNPTGDPTGFGLCENQGIGMQCTGFVWHVLVNAGANPESVPHLAQQHRGTWVAGWKKFIESNDIEHYSFDTKADMLNSGILQKGDIIMSWDEAAGGPSGISNYHHIGFFWGDNPSDDKYWHSGPVFDADTSNEKNCITAINAKTSDVIWWVVKTTNGPSEGSLRVNKASSVPALTSGNGSYSLADAVFQLKQDGVVKFSATTDDTGCTTFEHVPLGTYTLHEDKAPKGFLPAADTQVTIDGEQAASGKPAEATVSDKPAFDGSRIRVTKLDSELGTNTQGDATGLAGAEFTFRYYDGEYAAGQLPATPTRTWVMRSDGNGCASPFQGDAAKVSGDDFYYDQSGNVVIPLGTVAIEETKAPAGYRLDDGKGNAPKTFVAQLKLDASSPDGARIMPLNYEGDELDAAHNSPIASDEIVRGNLSGKKVDAATADEKAQGAATLGGAKIEVTNRSAHAVLSPLDGTTLVQPGEVVCTLRTNEDGSFSTASPELNGWSAPDDWNGNALAFGTYELREAQRAEGYLLNPKWKQTVKVREDGAVAEAEYALDELVYRGDLDFTKADEMTQHRLAGVPFMITSNTTGESHVLVTDANGMASTESSFNSHSSKTNANDEAVSSSESGAGATYKVDEGKLDDTAGIWFSGHGGEGGAPVDDELGALPYDTYTVTELPCKANAGLRPVSFEVKVYRHASTVRIGTVDDQPAPQIATTLTSKGGIHVVPAMGTVELVDTVSYSSMKPGVYVFQGELHALDAEGSDLGTVAEAEQTERIATASGEVKVTFKLNMEEIDEEASSFVAFESCYDEEGSLVADHADLDDEGQTVTVPDIATTFTDVEDGDHEAPATGEVTLCDTVEYAGLEPGKEYVLQLVVHRVADDGSDGGELLDAEGNPVSTTHSFTPEGPDGTENVTVTFTPAEEGVSAVAFEELRHNDETYAVHADITDTPQTVTFPAISTTAVDERTQTHIAAVADTLKIVDTVSYRNLEPGATYTLTGTVHLRQEDGTDGGEMQTTKNETASATTTFTPEEASGTVQLAFDDLDPLEAGTAAVVFEELSREGSDKPVAVHADIADDGQSVLAPRLQTTALESKSKTHEAPTAEPFTLEDTVAFENLDPNVECIVRGAVHAVDADGKDLGAAKRSDGSASEANLTFTPSASLGTVTLEFEVDPAKSEKVAKYVVFERGYVATEDGDVPIAVHEDLEDEHQSVHPTPDTPGPGPKEPSISTTATDKRSGNHVGTSGAGAVIVDNVTYDGLEAGAEYTLSGILMDKETSRPLKDEGAPVEAQAQFVAAEESGNVEMSFEISRPIPAGTRVVVFERLLDKKGDVVAVHEDIDSADQAVSYEPKQTPQKQSGTFDKAGYWFANLLWVLLPVGAALVALGIALRRKNNEHDNQAARR